MSNNSVILWNYFRSSASWRVRIALHLKGIEFEYRPVDLLAGGQFSEEFTKLNSKNEIPVLQIDNVTLLQSLPIIEYLDETRPEPRIIPLDPVKRQKARAIAEIVNSGIQPYQNTNVLKRIVSMAGEEKKNEWLQFYLHKGIKSLEVALKETSGKYCVGDEITIADLAFVPQIYSANRFKVDLSEYPNVRRVYAELEQLPAFKKANAHRQIDCPPELKEN